LNTYKINNIDAVLRDLSMSSSSCQFRPNRVYGEHGVPPRILYSKDEVNGILTLEEISDTLVMQQYLEEFRTYAKNFFDFMEKMQEKIQHSFPRNKEARVLYDLAAAYKPQVLEVVQHLSALEDTVSRTTIY